MTKSTDSVSLSTNKKNISTNALNLGAKTSLKRHKTLLISFFTLNIYLYLCVLTKQIYSLLKYQIYEKVWFFSNSCIINF